MPDSSLLRRELSEIKKQAGEVPVSINTGKSVTEITDLSKRMTEIAEKSKMASGAYDPAKLKANLAKAGLSVQKFNTEMEKTGQASKRLSSIDEMFHKLPGNIKRSESALDKFGKAMVNSMRYNLVNGVVDAIGNVKSTIDDFFRSVDKNLTQIRIVTGKAENSMDSMYRTGIKGAKEYGRYTREYLETAQIYYQQGLSQAEVMERTNATLMASNISGQDVATTSEQITAVLNGYNIEASRTVEILDMMAKIGAETATDFAEISASMQKVASAASETGMSVESTLGMLSTISSVTREAPETIGTSLNAIIGRLGALKAEEIGDASSFTSQVEKAMQNTGSGLSTFDVNGQLKDTTTILTDVAEKWDELDVNQQRALTTAMAGTRQANRLMALLGNWDMYEDYTNKAENASGAMEEQNKIYLESYEAAQKRLAATIEDLVSNLIDRDFLKDFTDGMTKIVELTSQLTKGFGGLTGILAKLAPLWGPAIGSNLAPMIAGKVSDITGRNDRMKLFATQTEAINRASVGEGGNLADGPIKLSPKELSRMGETEKNAYLEAAKAIAKKRVELRSLEELEKSYNYSIDENIKDLKAQAEELKKENKLIADNTKARIDLEEKLAKIEDKNSKDALNKKAQIAALGKPMAPKSADKLNASYKERVKQIMSESGMEGEAASILEEMKGTTNIRKNAKDLFNVKMDEGRFNAFVEAYRKRMATVQNAVKDSNKILNADVVEQEALMVRMQKEQKMQSVFNGVTKGVMALSAGLSTLNSMTDETATTQEKAQGAVAGLGSMLSFIPGWGTAAGMAVSLLGPIFIEVFGIGTTKAEKLKKKVDELTKSLDDQLKVIRQQRLDLAPISGLYENLAKQYEQQAFAYKDLNEEQRGQYDQVAEYVQKYAPELVKYYDEQGRAVIDLARGVEYLNDQYKQQETYAYKTLGTDVKVNAGLVSDQSIHAQRRQIEIQEELAEKQEKLLKTSDKKTREKLNKSIEALNTELTEVQQTITGIGQTWSETVVTPLLKSIDGFNDLSEETQNAARAAIGYRDAVLSGFETDVYIERIKDTMISLSLATQETKDEFAKLPLELQSGVIKIQSTMNGIDATIKNSMLSLTQAQYLEGSFLDQIYKIDPDKFASNRIGEINSAIDKIREELKPLDTLETTGEYDGGLYAQNAKEAEAAGAPLTTEEQEYIDKDNALNNAIANEEEYNAILKDLEDEKKEILDNTAEYQEKHLEGLEQIWQDSLMEFASSIDGHNAIYEAWVKEKAKLDKEASERGGSTDYENEVEQNDKRLAVLLKDDEKYFKQLKENNLAAMTENELNYQVDADNYRTWAEYKAALDAAIIQKRQLLEDIALSSGEDKEAAILKFKVSSHMQQLEAEGNFAAKKALIMATSAQQEKMTSIRAAKDQVDATIARLKEEQAALAAAAESGAKIDEEKVKASIAAINKEIAATELLINAKRELAGEEAITLDRAIYSGAGTPDYDWIIEDLGFQITALEGQSKALQDEYNKIVQQVAEENKDFALQLEKAMNGANIDFSGINLTPEQKEKLKDAEDLLNKGGGGADKEKPFEEEIDYLREYLIILDELERELQKVNDLKETSVGPAYLKALKEEQRITKEMLENEKFKQQLAEDEAARLKGEISKINSGISFNDFGMIENYNEILKQAEAKINLLSGAEREAAIEQWETLKELMTDYEEVIGDGYDALEAQREKAMELSAQKLEAIEYEIDMIVKVSERDKETLDAFLEFAKLQAGKNAISIDFSGAMTNLVNAAKMVSDLFNSDAMNNDAINNILNDPDLTDADKETALEAVRDQYLSNMEELVSTLQDMDEMFADGLENVAKVLEEHLEQFDAILSQYEYMMDLMDRTGADPSGKNGLLDQMVGIYNTQIGAWQQAAEGFKDARDSFEVGTDEWLTANAQYMAAMDKVMGAEKQLLDALESKFDNSVSSGRTSLEEALFGGMSADEAKKALQEQQEAREKYLDTQERIYETSKLERDIQKEIDKYTNNPKAQAQLKKFMDSELSYLKNKEKLTESDLELSQKQYNIVKARIAMEEAREQKQFVQTLQRNANGTFGFVFSAGPNEEFEKAKQDYENAINDLYEFAMKEKDRLENESISIKEQFLSDYDEILGKLKAGKITQEEADRALIDSRDKMLEKLKENAEQQAIMNQQIAGTEIMQILAKAGADPEAFAGLESQSEALKSIFDTLEEAKAISGDEMASVLESLGLNINDYSGSLGEIINSAIEDLGGDEEALKELTDAFAASGNETVKDLLDLVAGNSNLSGMIDDIFDQTLNGAGSNLGDFMDDALAGFDEVSGQFDEDNPDSLFNTIKDGVLGIFAEYNATLEDAMDRMEEHLGNVGEVAGVITDATQGVVDGLVSEIDKLVELQKEYASLREEIIKTIEVLQQQIANANAALESLGTTTNPFPGIDEEPNFTGRMVNGDVVLGNNSDILASASVDLASMTTPTSFLGDIISAVAEGVYASKDAVKDYFTSKFMKGNSSPAVTEGAIQQAPTQVTINADFPNATNKDEIVSAFETLRLNAEQYVNKK